ncbi:hypothetical protein GcM3_196049, partial [Golovinomyces cichoracearum]
MATALDHKQNDAIFAYEGKPEQIDEDDIVDTIDDEEEDYTRDVHFTAAYLSDK